MTRPRITIATYITLSRFFLVPLFLYFFLNTKYLHAMITLGLAGFTDLLDGFVARRFNMRTRLGSMLDPLADKFLVLVSFIALSRTNIIPWNLTALVIGRDLLILSGVLVLNLMKIRLYYKPTRTSKLATFTQIALLGISLLEFFMSRKMLGSQKSKFWDEWLNLYFVHQVQQIFVILAAVCTAITCFQYGYIGWQFYRYGERLKEKI